MVKLVAFAVVAAALLHIVASQPYGHEELDYGSSQVKSEQPLTSGSMSLEGDIKPTHNTKANHQFVFSPLFEILKRMLFFNSTGACTSENHFARHTNHPISTASFKLKG